MENAYINDKIFKSSTDYMLGGFTMKDYESIKTNNNKPISFAKIQYLIELKIKKAIETFIKEVREIAERQFDDQDNKEDLVLNRIAQEIQNLGQVYLQQNIYTIDVDIFYEFITSTSAFKNWVDTLEKRVHAINSQLITKELSQTESEIFSTEEIDGFIADCTLEEILEKLAIIIDNN